MYLRRMRAFSIVFLALLMVGMVRGTLFLGQDTNWDAQNYHHYAPWAVIHGGYQRDVLAGNWQSYLNPAIYFIRYATHWTGPATSAAILAALQSLAMIPIFLLALLQFQPATDGRTSLLLAMMATLLAALSPAYLGELGTSFADGLLALPMLLAVLLLSVRGNSVAALALSGVLMGAAVGFKLTNLLFLPGYALAAVIQRGSWRAAVQAAAIACLGGLVGFLLAAGPWAVVMWRWHGNPFFPLFGSYFDPVERIAGNPHDQQFIPKSWTELLSLPLRWALGGRTTAEVPFADARPLLLCILGAGLLVALALRRRGPLRALQGYPLRMPAFFVVGTVCWISFSAIHRYAIVLELLLGPMIVLALIAILRSWPAIATAASGVAVMLTLIVISPADWWKTGSFASTPYGITLHPELQAPATYVMMPQVGSPMGYLVPDFPKTSAFVLFNYDHFFRPDSVIGRQGREALDNPRGGRMFLLTDGPVPTTIVAGGRSWRVSAPCLGVPNVIRPVLACPMGAAGD